MFLAPHELTQYLLIEQSASVADFGAGSGLYALHLAERAPYSSIYALDISPNHVRALDRRAREAGFSNLSVLHADLNEPLPFKGGHLGGAFLVNTLHALTARAEFLAELHRVLQAGAPVLCADWCASFKGMGPATDAVIPPGEAVRLFRAHGFTTGAMLPAGSHHFAFVARRA